MHIRCPTNQKMKSYARQHLQCEWGTIYRIRPSVKSSYVNWCEDNIKDEWSHSLGHEVYYFKNSTDAALFKLIYSGEDL